MSNILMFTEQVINDAYEKKIPIAIEKETMFVFQNILLYLLNKGGNLIKKIKPSEDIRIKDDPSYLISNEHYDNLKLWLKTIEKTSDKNDIGRLMVDFEYWFYKITYDGTIQFEYTEDYLLTPSKAAEELGISKPTLYKYMKQGLEFVETKSHKKVPKYVVELWKDPVYATKMQILFQEKKMRSQTPYERLAEVNEEILAFEEKYAGTFEDIFKDVEGDKLDEAMDFFTWRDLIAEKKELLLNLKVQGGKCAK